MLTQDALNELFDYNPETGILSRKIKPKCLNNCKPQSDRYKQVRIDGKPHRVHRIIWLMIYGQIPKGKLIDHINGNRHDNRLCNLRLATRAENVKNQNVVKGSTSKFKGVHKKTEGVFIVNISDHGKTIYIGRFKSEIEAAKAYDEAAIQRYGQYAKTNKALGLLKECRS